MRRRTRVSGLWPHRLLAAPRGSATHPHPGNRRTDLIDKIWPRRADRMDIIADFAEPFPAIVTAEMLGVPIADHVQLKDWSADFAEMLGNFQHNPDARPSCAAERRGHDRLFPQRDPQQESIRARRPDPFADDRRGRRRAAHRRRSDRQHHRHHGRRPGNHHQPDRQRPAHAAAQSRQARRSCATDLSLIRRPSKSCCATRAPASTPRAWLRTT